MKKSEIYLRAANVFESGTKGWHQGSTQSKDGSAYCMGKAMLFATGQTHYYLPEDVGVVYFAQCNLQGSIAGFNDTKGRTKGEVIDKLRELAKLAREEEELNEK